MNRVESIVDRVGALPALPGTALKLMGAINDPRSTVADIMETIKYDQAVTGEVLRLCNSAYFGLSRMVTSLNDAVKCLGTIKVLQLVISVHTNSLLSGENAGYGLQTGALWKHSVAVALASSAMGQRMNLPNTNCLFTAGLLHDIGKVVLCEYVADEFTEIVRQVTELGRSFVEAEHAILGFSHAEVGGLVAEKWNLPEAMVRCIRFHHEPDAVVPPDPLIDAVYLANCICLLLGIGLGKDGLCYRAHDGVMRRHGLQTQDIEAVGAETVVELQRVEQLFADAAAPTRTRERAGSR